MLKFCGKWLMSLIVLVSLSTCQDTSKNSTSQLEQIAFSGVEASSASVALYVADKQNFFRNEGLDVRFSYFPTSDAALKNRRYRYGRYGLIKAKPH